MEYRVIHRTAATDELVHVFESAYDAVDFVAGLWYRREPRASRLYIVDSEGSTLLEPFDLAGVARAGEAA